MSVYTTSPHGSPTGISVAAGAGGANLLARDSGNYHNWFPYTDGLNYYSADGHVFRSSNHLTNYVNINSNGNVGIGTSSPASKLHLDDATAPYITITRTGVPTWQLRNNFPSNQYGFSFNNTTAGTVPLFIGAGGNIGIGLDSPAAKLDIVGTTTTIALSFGTTVANNPLFINTYGSNTGIGMDQTTAGLRLAGDYGGGSNPLVDIGYYAGGTVSHANWVNRLRVQNNGNVGIGTTSPTHKLDIRGDVVIKGDSTQHSVLRFRRSDVSAYDFAYIGFENPALSNDTFLISSAGNGNPLKLQAGASDTITFFGNTVEYARFNGNGNLGIGTTSPTSQLHVVGNVQLYGTSGGNININTAASGNGDISFDGSTFTIVSNSSSAPIVLSTNSTERMRIISNGNVGIGTSSPGVKLDVIGGVRSFSSAGNYGLITNGSFQAVGDHGGTFMLDLDNTGAADLVNVKKSGTSRFYIKNDGNVGIGTTAPADKLDVVGTVRTDKLRSNGIYYVGITGAKSSNATSFNMFDINNTGGNQTIEIVLSHHHSGGGQHGSFRRTILALNSYTDFIVLEDTSTNFGGGLGFTITRTSATTIRIGWAGATSYAGSYSFIGWIKGNGDYSVTNVGMDSFDAA